jgi:phosphatidylglycerol lysyltransferase
MMNEYHRHRAWRRAVTTAVVLLGVSDFVQAGSRHSIARIGWLSLHLGGSTTRLFRYVLLVAGLTLFSVVKGLLRGKRLAWIVAIGATATSLVGHHLVKADALGIAFAGCTMGLLVAQTRQFRARRDPALSRQGMVWLFVGGGITYAYGVFGLYLLDAQFRSQTSFVESMEQAVRLLILLPTSTIEPRTRHGAWFIDSVRVMAIVVLLSAIARILSPVLLYSHRHERDLDHVRRLLDKFSTSALGYFHLLPDKHHMFADDYESCLSYKLVGSVAVVLGGPFGSAQSCRSVTQEFLQRCELNGWLPAFHQVTPEDCELLTPLGLKTVKIGEEAVIDVKSFALVGSHFKNIRSRTAKMQRLGWKVQELIQPIDEQTMARLRTISDAWLADGHHRERTFTLGLFDEDYLRSTIVLVAIDPAGEIRAFTNIIDSFQSRSGTFDLMRRDPTEREPVMDVLFLAMIERFRSSGLHGMNLGLAPLANITGDSFADRTLRLISQRGTRAFNFEGIRAYKDKWQPEWEPRYLAYRADSELAQIAVGVSRAGELSSPESGRMEALDGVVGSVVAGAVRLSRRLPFTIGISALIGVLQIATQIDRDAYDRLRSTFDYNWYDLAQRHQLYRLITAIFIEQGHGIRLGVLSLIPLVGVSEYVLGSRRSFVVFFLSDLCSSIPILVFARLLAQSGSAPAMRVLETRDGGTSAAMFGLIAAAALTLREPRLCRVCVCALIVYLAGALVLFHRLFDVQHVGAALVGTIAWVIFTADRQVGPKRRLQFKRRHADITRVKCQQ